MPKINVVVPHRLARDEASARIKKLLTEVKTQFADKIENLEEKWKGDTGTFSFDAMGFAVSGSLSVKANQVALTANLPFAAMIFKNKIEEAIKERAEALLV